MNNLGLEATFEQIYVLLLQFSNQIATIKKTTTKITARLDSPAPKLWNEYLHYYDMGAYYHHRCQGYVECMRVIKNYHPYTINFWVNELVYPAADNFKKSSGLYQKIKSTTSVAMSDITLLDQQLAEFKKIAGAILQYANRITL